MFGTVAKSFGKNFLIAYLVPSFFFVILNILFTNRGFLPKLNDGVDIPIDRAIKTLILISLISLIIRQFTTQIVRVYEGYYRKKVFILGFIIIFSGIIFSIETIIDLVRFIFASNVSMNPIEAYDKNPIINNLTDSISLLNIMLFFSGFLFILTSIYQSISIRLYRSMYARHQEKMSVYDFSRKYPRDIKHIMPTRIGNIIRSFEHYPHFLYNIDAMTIWPRMIAIIPEYFRAQIDESETNFYFFFNLSFLFVVLGIESMSFFVKTWSFFVLWVCIFNFIIAYILYNNSCSKAILWGEYVRGSFDLYRLDLLKQMGVFLPPKIITLKDEKRIWGFVQRITFRAIDPGPSLKFLPKSWELDKITQQQGEEMLASESSGPSDTPV